MGTYGMKALRHSCQLHPSPILAGLKGISYNPRRYHATIAQSVEQTFRKRQVKGPNPFGGSR